MAAMLPLQETDLQQIALLTRILAEGKFEVRGDAVLTVASSFRWLAALADRVKLAQSIPTAAPISEITVPVSKKLKKG